MIENFLRTQYEAMLPQVRHFRLALFLSSQSADRPRDELAPARHRRQADGGAGGRIQRLIINLPPRHLKSLMAPIAYLAWCLREGLLKYRSGGRSIGRAGPGRRHKCGSRQCWRGWRPPR
jgi:hypothetical protein